MKLVVGLGNPGRKYEGTRHNIGFDVLNLLVHHAGGGRPKTSFQGEVLDATVAGQRFVLLWPHTFMNRSGTSVVQARDFYKLTNENVLVICDDFVLPVGKLRIRARGSSGGQKGLEDIIRCFGTDEFPRLRVGIGPVPDHWNPADFVLGRFAAGEKKPIDESIQRAAEAVSVWARDGIDRCMNLYN
jgi:PTH1 family peptidyl-tRNA hydrolase